MVEVKLESHWECPYCSQEYDNFDEAQECAEGCVEVDSPNETTKTSYSCEFCKKIYEADDDAEECEALHKDTSDDFYEKKRLEDASRHPQQKTLARFLEDSNG